MDDLKFSEGGGDENLKFSSMVKPKVPKTNASINERANLLIELLKTCPRSSDLLWSLFRASCESYKFDSLLRPFPKEFLDVNGEKMISRLRLVAASVGSIPEVLKNLEDGVVSQDVIDLLFWVLNSSRSFKLKSVMKSEFSHVLNKVQPTDSCTAIPHYIFEVDHSEKASTAKFELLAKNYGTRFAFHGSRIENFFSILNYGLQVSMNKVAVFGPGVYLSSELGVSLAYSPAGLTWGGSGFGGSLSVVAVCEMIDHPDVKCQDDKISSRKYAEGKRNSQVPNKYFIVQNSDLVRVSHLLVYARPKNLVGTKHWTRFKTLPAIVTAYFLLLIVIALYNSPYFMKKLAQVWRIFFQRN